MNNALHEIADEHDSGALGYEDSHYSEYIYHDRPVLFDMNGNSNINNHSFVSPAEKIASIREDFDLRFHQRGFHQRGFHHHFSRANHVEQIMWSKSCGALLNGEMILIGGMNHKKKVLFVSSTQAVVCLNFGFSFVCQLCRFSKILQNFVKN